jgi:hypothetical protein
METITISRSEYENMIHKLARLKELEKIDFDLVRKFRKSLEDVKAGRIIRVA